jgi:hypothetical protein
MAKSRKTSARKSAAKPQAFLPITHRRDALTAMARDNRRIMSKSVQDLLSAGMVAPTERKLDGKNGAVDGVDRWQGGTLPGAGGPKVLDGKGPVEGKGFKEGKDFTEGGDLNTNKQGDDSFNTLTRYGDPAMLNWAAIDQVGAVHGLRMQQLLKSGPVI